MSSPDIKIAAIIRAKAFDVLVVGVCHGDTLLFFTIITYLVIIKTNVIKYYCINNHILLQFLLHPIFQSPREFIYFFMQM